MPNSKRIVYLSQAQYAELIDNGSITVDGVTVTYDENDIYVTPQGEPITDVQVNGRSVVTSGVANVPVAAIASGQTSSNIGVVKVRNGYDGLKLFADDPGRLMISPPTAAQIKAGSDPYVLVVASVEHAAAFYGMAKAAGDTTQKNSSNAVGTYTDEAKAAIQNMLGIVPEKWELIRDYIPEQNANTISITTDERNESFALKKALILCQYQATDTTTNNNEVVVDMRGGSAQFATIKHCNSVNEVGDCIVEVDCSSGVQLCRISYSTTSIITTSYAYGSFVTNELVNPAVSEMSSFMMRLGVTGYKFNASTTRIRIYGVRK